jgi:hypothetical protein
MDKGLKPLVWLSLERVLQTTRKFEWSSEYTESPPVWGNLRELIK